MIPAPRRQLGVAVNDRVASLVALVVDDEYLIAVELEAIMESSGYDVLSAINVHEARQLMDLRSIDVAVLNFRMKDGTLDLARDLEARGVPLVFCTGSLPEEVHALFPGVAIVPKPFTAAGLLAIVKAAIYR
ncbi:MAG: response regulator [Hyphomicrobiales bacterium]|nr:MAG: response regulator [Hyphomicrobiales bacterium]